MSRPPVDVHLVLIEGMEKWIKIVAYLWAANWLYDFICVLPPDIGNQVMEAILKKIGIKS
jgi:hypothetical protein